MPPRGYRSLTIREEDYRRLEELRRRLGLRSIADVIRHMLEEHDGLEERIRVLEERVSRLEKLVALLAGIEPWTRVSREEVEEAGEELSRRLLEDSTGY